MDFRYGIEEPSHSHLGAMFCYPTYSFTAHNMGKAGTNSLGNVVQENGGETTNTS